MDPVICSDCGNEYNRLYWGVCPHCNGGIDSAIVLQPVHLGTGEIGVARRKALEAVAAEAGHFWGGKPSIGRWIVAVADEKRKGQESF